MAGRKDSPSASKIKGTKRFLKVKVHRTHRVLRNRPPTRRSDRNAEVIAQILRPLVNAGQLRIPKGGYLLRRGRGRVILDRPNSSD